MKTPPLLLGCALLFWGWQSDLLWVGAVMGALVEAARIVKQRWEFTDEEFRRIVMFCELAGLAALLYAFSANDGPASFGGLVEDQTLGAQKKAGNATVATALAVIRWLPMVFFLFVVAQAYSTRPEVPVAVGSLVQWRRRQAAWREGKRLPPGRTFNAGWPYFGVCLGAASMHSGGASGYFWGFVVLMAWALWTVRPHRFHALIWVVALGVAATAGFFGQQGILQLQSILGGMSAKWMGQLLDRGRFDPTRTKTAIGEVGRISQSGGIVLRLEIPPGLSPPPLLREASYDNYRITWWSVSPTNREFADGNVETNLTSWVRIPNKRCASSVRIANYLPGRRGVLPLPSGCGRIDHLDVDSVKLNGLGTTWAEGPGLVIYDARFAPGATADAPANSTEDLRVPDEETNSLDSVIGEMSLAGLDDAHKLAAVRSLFATKFTYILWQREPRRMTNYTHLGRFLMATRSGHCEYFATATTLMLRRLGIPARYAVGYVVHEESGADKYVVRYRDAHAWCLVWNAAAQRWEDFDTTPGTRNALEAERKSPFEFFSDAWSRAWFEFSKFRWGQSHIRQYILWALLPVLAFLLWQIVWRARRGRKKSAAESAREWPGRDSEFYRLEKPLAEFIGARRGDETLAIWLARAAAEPALRDTSVDLREILRLHYAYRFDPQGLSAPEREALRQRTTECLRALPAARNLRGGTPSNEQTTGWTSI